MERKYDGVVVDCSLRLCGDRMKRSLPKKFFFFRETPTSPWVLFSVSPRHPLVCSLCKADELVVKQLNKL